MIVPGSVLAIAVCAATACPAKFEVTAKGGARLPAGTSAEGRRLFALNCAHCHGDDARGDEGPSLYGLHKTDARLGKIIREGIKGEMPSFGRKFSENEVKALIAFLRTLKE